MIKKKLLAAACAVALAAGAAIAHEGDHGMGEGMGEGMEILHSLNLSDVQKEQAHTIEQAAWAQAKPIMTQMRTVHEQMAGTLLQPGTVSADQLAPMVTQEEQLRNQIDQVHLNAVLQIRALLTPAQLALAGSMHAKLAALHKQERAVTHASEDGGQ